MIKKYFMFVLAIFITGFWSITAEAETIVVTPNHIIKDQKDYYLDGHTWYNDGIAVDSSTLFSTEESSSIEPASTETTPTDTAITESTNDTKETTTETSSPTSESSIENKTSTRSSSETDGRSSSTTFSVESSIRNENKSASDRGESSVSSSEELETEQSTEIDRVEKKQEPNINMTNPSKNLPKTNRLPETGEKAQTFIRCAGIMLIGFTFFIFKR